MSKLFNNRNLTAGAFIAAATLSILSFGGSAQASTSVLSCVGPSAGKVIDCCQKLTRQDRPLWMRDTGSTCREIVVCRKYSRNGRCYVRVVQRENETHNRSRSRGQRSSKN
jgi:hypothetical protein